MESVSLRSLFLSSVVGLGCAHIVPVLRENRSANTAPVGILPHHDNSIGMPVDDQSQEIEDNIEDGSEALFLRTIGDETINSIEARRALESGTPQDIVRVLSVLSKTDQVTSLGGDRFSIRVRNFVRIGPQMNVRMQIQDTCMRVRARVTTSDMGVVTLRTSLDGDQSDLMNGGCITFDYLESVISLYPGWHVSYKVVERVNPTHIPGFSFSSSMPAIREQMQRSFDNSNRDNILRLGNM